MSIAALIQLPASIAANYQSRKATARASAFCVIGIRVGACTSTARPDVSSRSIGSTDEVLEKLETASS